MISCKKYVIFKIYKIKYVLFEFLIEKTNFYFDSTFLFSKKCTLIVNIYNQVFIKKC